MFLSKINLPLPSVNSNFNIFSAILTVSRFVHGFGKIKTSNFINSGWDEKKQEIDFFEDKRLFDGTVGVFYYGSARIILYKTICMNLLRVSSEEKKIIQEDLPVVGDGVKNSNQISLSSGTPVYSVGPQGPQGDKGDKGADGITKTVSQDTTIFVYKKAKLWIPILAGVGSGIASGYLFKQKGDQGIPGIQGPNGAPGKDGLPGTPGKDGKDGKDGLPGKDGKDGKDGLTGPTGPQGPRGNDGPQGPQGPTGPQGPKGDPGNQGPTGPGGTPLPGNSNPGGTPLPGNTNPQTGPGGTPFGNIKIVDIILDYLQPKFVAQININDLYGNSAAKIGKLLFRSLKIKF